MTRHQAPVSRRSWLHRLRWNDLNAGDEQGVGAFVFNHQLEVISSRAELSLPGRPCRSRSAPRSPRRPGACGCFVIHQLGVFGRCTRSPRRAGRRVRCDPDTDEARELTIGVQNDVAMDEHRLVDT